MDCPRAAELTPWYLNGTLEAAERAELERHLAGCAACGEERAEAEATLVLFGGHPSAEMLVSYAFEGPEAPRDLVEAHLAGCEACVEELAMVLDSRRELQRAEAPQPPAEVVPLRQPAATRPAWWAAAVAAALIGLIGIGIGAWSLRALERQRDGFAERQRADQLRIAELEAEIRGFERARVNVPIHDLWPDGSVLRSADSGPARLPVEEGPAATLILNSQLEAGSEVDRVEIRDDEGRVLESLTGVRAEETGSITMSLKLARLPRGRLGILLFAAGEETPIETYTFEPD